MSRYLTAGFGWSLLFAFIVINIALYMGASNAYRTTSVEEAEAYLTQMKAARQEWTPRDIFIHNLKLTWFIIVPTIGAFPFFFVMYQTGWTIGVLSVAYGIAPQTLIAFAWTRGFLEMLAYVIALAENMYLTAMLLAEKFRERLPQSAKSWVLYVLLLMIGAVTEYYAIRGG